MSDDRIPIPIQATGYLRMHVPDDLADGPAPCVMAMHGYAQDPEAMFAFAQTVAPPGAVVVAPEGPQAFYAERWRKDVGNRAIAYGWLADPRRPDAEARNRTLLAGALDTAHAVHPLDPARTILLGYSQGVGVAVDFAVHHKRRVAGIVGLAGGVPTHGRQALPTLRGLPVLWLTGLRDRFYTPEYCARMVEQLEAAGTELDAEALDVGHGILPPTEARVAAWIAARL